MARIPLEDNFNDVINKTQRGLKISDEALAQRAEVTAEDLAAVKGGTPLSPPRPGTPSSRTSRPASPRSTRRLRT
ncbi:MAG: hypothetical protein NT173_10820 [Opitutales bacterium]|nr:hypothetical protein [Opitutales bacterium]